MRIGSLFTGYGGLDIAVSAFFDAKLSWYSEIEPAACKILEKHHPGVVNLGDVTRIDWLTVEPIDILIGGYPCQPFSNAGKRKGKDDERHLWPFVAAAVGSLRPRYVVLENVRGHLSLGLADVVGELASLGYDCRWGVVRASDTGAPHGRARVFIVAYPHGQGLQGHVNQPSETSSVRRGHSEPSDSFLAHPTSTEWGDKESEHMGTSYRSATEPRECSSEITDADGYGYGGGSNTAGMGEVERGNENFARERERSRGESEPRSIISWGKYEPAIRIWERNTRPAPDPTITGDNGKPRLSPIFVEWMMGLPEGWVTGYGLRPAQELKLLGNGVCPQQAMKALTLLMEGL